MRTLFVTASGTEIGKTLIVTILAHQIRNRGKSVRALKPVVTGLTPETVAKSDTALILQSLGDAVTPETVEAVSPWRFAEPLSPDMAAAREGRRIDLDAVVEFCRDAERGDQDVLLIEGVGGVMAPLTASESVLDWMAALNVQTLLVVGSYLGTISHTLTAGRGLTPDAVIVSESPQSPVPPAETKATLARFLGDLPIVLLPRLAAGETISWPNFKAGDSFPTLPPIGAMPGGTLSTGALAPGRHRTKHCSDHITH